jgi:hypothetical protein
MMCVFITAVQQSCSNGLRQNRLTPVRGPAQAVTRTADLDSKLLDLSPSPSGISYHLFVSE